MTLARYGVRAVQAGVGVVGTVAACKTLAPDKWAELVALFRNLAWPS